MKPKKKKSDEKGNDAGLETDEESLKPIKDGDKSRSSLMKKSLDESSRSQDIYSKPPSPPLFDRNYHHQVEQNIAIKVKKAKE